MGSTVRRAHANRTQGCLVCGDWRDEMIALVDHGAMVCRPCVARIGRAILAASPLLVGQLWPTSPSVGKPGQEKRLTLDVDVEQVFAAFKAGIEKQIRVANAVAHVDLAVAYGEMGLMAEAIREAATALGERAPLPIASRALNWLFSPGRAHPDALRTVVRTLRSE